MKKLLAFIAFLLPMAVMAQEKDPTATVPQSENNLRIAAELSKYGYANNDALSLIQAARMSKQAGYTVAAQEKTTEGGQDTTDESAKKGQVSLDPAKLLADAKTMAGNDGVMLAIIDDVNSNVRGASGGQKYTTERVNAKSTDVYKIQFRGGEMAMVIVIGDGDTDLDLYVYDSSGNLVASDTDYSDDCVVSWVPRWTSTYTIKVVNRGNVYNRYVIRTN